MSIPPILLSGGRRTLFVSFHISPVMKLEYMVEMVSPFLMVPRRTPGVKVRSREPTVETRIRPSLSSGDGTVVIVVDFPEPGIHY